MKRNPPGSRATQARRIELARRERWTVGGICALLAALVWAVFGQTASFPFTNYDDGEYVFQNPHVTGGLTAKSIGWAFTHSYASNWHPLTWLTHMADWQFHGDQAGWHHLTNILLHSAAAILLFLALRQLAGSTWRCAFVAALFAVHPLRAESVAWVAERKDVLSGLFFALTLLAWGKWAKDENRANPSPRSYFILLASYFLFALGLMSKPSLVTLPFVLLLLDYWPLGRYPTAGWRRLLLEKLPFFALSAASCLVTIFAQTKALMPVARFPLAGRLENTACSYVAYLWQTVWPVNLAVFYPLHPPPWWVFGASLALLAAVT